MSTLNGVQYVRLAPGAARAVARFLDSLPPDIDELVMDLGRWPAGIQPIPQRARDGRLLAGDPLLLDATEAGLLFSCASTTHEHDTEAVLVSWRHVRQMTVLGSRE